jgi:hypothetical protein
MTHLTRQVNQVKHIFIAALVAAAYTVSADASPFGPDHGFDPAYAAVEDERRAPSERHPEWLADVIEHSIGPETAPRLAQTVRDERDRNHLEASHQPRNPKE